MSIPIDFHALQAEIGPPVSILDTRTVSRDGTGDIYTGFEVLDRVEVTIDVSRVRGKHDESITVFVEHSDDGNTWVPVTQETFTQHGEHHASLDSPKSQWRARWTITDAVRECVIRSVAVIPGTFDEPGGGGSFPDPFVVTGTDPDAVTATIQGAPGQNAGVFQVLSEVDGASLVDVQADGEGGPGQISLTGDDSLLTLGTGVVSLAGSSAILLRLPLAEPSDDLLNQQGLVVFWATNTPGETKLNLKLRDSDDAIIKASVGPTVLYDYTVVTPQASIDTFVNDGGNGVGVDLSGAHNILEMWIVGRTDQAADNSQHDVILNNDTGAHYDQQVIQGVGSGFNVFANQATNAWTFAMRGDNSLAGYASVQRFSFPSYATSDFFKTAESILGMVNDDGGQNFARTEALGWRSTDPITRVKMTSVGTYLAGTRLLIYGR